MGREVESTCSGEFSVDMGEVKKLCEGFFLFGQQVQNVLASDWACMHFTINNSEFLSFICMTGIDFGVHSPAFGSCGQLFCVN